MTHDEAVTKVREGLKFLEAELQALGHDRALRRVLRAHASLQDVADDYVQSGTISALSVGGDKP